MSSIRRAGSRRDKSGMPRSRSSGMVPTKLRNAGEDGVVVRPCRMVSRSFASRWCCFCRSSATTIFAVLRKASRSPSTPERTSCLSSLPFAMIRYSTKFAVE